MLFKCAEIREYRGPYFLRIIGNFNRFENFIWRDKILKSVEVANYPQIKYYSVHKNLKRYEIISDHMIFINNLPAVLKPNGKL